MKKVIFISLIISLIIGSCAKQESKFPQGAWQLVQMVRVTDGISEVRFPITSKGSTIKMWSENHYLIVGRFQVDTTFMDNYSGGTYTLIGDRYEENILYHVNTNAIGQNPKMKLEQRNDTLVQTNPVDDNGQPNKDGYYIEKYIRLD